MELKEREIETEVEGKVERTVEPVKLSTWAWAAPVLLSFVLWPRKKAAASSHEKVMLKKSVHSIARASNQTGRLEKA